jgi:two-component system cell cycle response regulator
MDMDEKCATQIFGSVAKPDSSSVTVVNGSRPMYLIMVGGGIPGEMIRLSKSGGRIGRSSENSVQFLEASISRRHAAIVADAKGHVYLTDLGSTNGTFLNGIRLSPRACHRIKDGDRIQFGSTVVVKYVRLDPCDEQFQRELFERTVRDNLTSLYNRSYFLEHLGPLAERGASRGLGLAVLMLDVDHFKRVNDSYGHDVGDQVLYDVANVLRDSTRTEDLVARYGGEEFVVALPVAAPDQATERAERIRANLASRRIDTLAGTLRVTASLGLAFAPAGRVRNPSALISAADHCLYEAKGAGRNRVIFRVDGASVNGWRSDSATPRSDEV